MGCRSEDKGLWECGLGVATAGQSRQTWPGKEFVREMQAQCTYEVVNRRRLASYVFTPGTSSGCKQGEPTGCGVTSTL